jgi:hypothetical protein
MYGSTTYGSLPYATGPSISAPITLTLTGIASSSAFGTPMLSSAGSLLLELSGIPSSSAFGSVVIIETPSTGGAGGTNRVVTIAAENGTCGEPYVTFYYKDPDATLDYIWNWSAYLTADDDTILTHSFLTSSTDVSVLSSLQTDTTTTAWLTGGTAFTEYGITCRITTHGGRTDDRTLKLICIKR